MGRHSHTSRNAIQDPFVCGTIALSNPTGPGFPRNPHEYIVFVLKNNRQTEMLNRITSTTNLCRPEIKNDHEIEWTYPMSLPKKARRLPASPEAIDSSN